MTLRNGLFAATGAVGLALTVAPVGAADLQPGLWELSSKSDRDGVIAQRPLRKQCITPDKAKQVTEQVSRALPKNEFGNRGANCKIIDLKTTDQEVTWRTECSGFFPAEQTGRYVVDSPQHVTSEVHSSVKLAQKTLSSTVTTEGRRIGECPK